MRMRSTQVQKFADEATRESVDAKCRKLTAPWVRERAATVPDIELCGFFEDFEKAGADGVLPPGVYTLQVLAARDASQAGDLCVL